MVTEDLVGDGRIQGINSYGFDLVMTEYASVITEHIR